MTLKIRLVNPVRRVRPDSRATMTYEPHKDNLREDFNRACGYCGSDMTSSQDFHIDHFVPQRILTKARVPITLGHYGNLVYSCRDCNYKKGGIWPTEIWNVHHENDVGLIDPCDELYEDQFCRTDEGYIIGSTQLGKYISEKVFKFPARALQLGLFWKKQKIRSLISELEGLKTDDMSNLNLRRIDTMKMKLSVDFIKYDNELKLT